MHSIAFKNLAQNALFLERKRKSFYVTELEVSRKFPKTQTLVHTRLATSVKEMETTHPYPKRLF